MGVSGESFTNLFGDGEVSGSSPDAQGDFYLLTDAQADHNYLQEKIADAISALSTTPTGDFLIIYGGVVSDGGSGTINISECLCKTKDTNGKKRLVYIPALTGIALPSDWNDGRSIWVTARYDFKLGTLTRTHKLGGSYHYQIADTYMGDSAGYISTGPADLFTTSDPVATATILGKFTMTGTTFADLGVRSPVLDLNSGNTAVIATAAGTTTLTAASEPVQHFTGTTTQSVVLPVAASMGLIGKRFRIVNRSTGVVTVYASNGSSVVKALEAGGDAEFVCIALSGVTGTSWMVKNYVNTNGAQTIAGVKTFSSIPLLPASDPTTDNQAVRKAFVNSYVDYMMKYDYVVDSPTKFNALIASGTWLNSKNVLFTVDVAATAQITIPATVEKIHAINGATITVTGLTTGQYGLGYATTPTDPKYEMRGVRVNASGTGMIYGLRRCFNMYSCYGVASSTSGASYGVNGCTNLINCRAQGTGTGTSDGNGFYACNKLTNCAGAGTSAVSSAAGFSSCESLTSCTGTGTTGGASTGIGFFNCRMLSNCEGTGTRTGSGDGYGYYNITYAGFCTIGSASSTATWGGTNAKIRGCEDISDIT